MDDFSLEVFPPTLERILTHLNKVRKSSKGWTACCPSHDDHNPSLSIGIGKDGKLLLHCFAGCPYEAIVEALGLRLSDLSSVDAATSPRQKETTRHLISLLDLAQKKLIPWKFLCNLGIVEEPRGIRISYYCLDGTIAPRYRIRTALAAKEGSYWNKGPGDILPYGLERLEEARQAGFLFLVEGESDCWTLWYHGFPALGLPGAEMANKLKADDLTDIRCLYLLREPDAAGTKFVEGIVRLLTIWNWEGTASVVSLPNAKDPNELHQQDWKGFKAAFQNRPLAE
jgi:putative DNA primase/helicase